MSTLRTRSCFFYGTSVTTLNRSIDFDEGAGEIQATLDVGDYSFTEYITAFVLAMNIAGNQVYTATIDRDTGTWTLSAPNPFSIKGLTGSRAATSAWPMAGFGALDHTGDDSYEAPNRVGEIYELQYPASDYLAAEDNIHKEQATYNFTASGVSQIISFDDSSRIRMNIILITNKLNLKNDPFFSNASGVQDARDFMTYAVTKSRMEFMPDTDNKAVFHTCLLESTREDRSGLLFELKNMGAADFYETGVLTFRKVGG